MLRRNNAYTKVMIIYIQNPKECKLMAGKKIYHKIKASKGMENNITTLEKFIFFFI